MFITTLLIIDLVNTEKFKNRKTNQYKDQLSDRKKIFQEIIKGIINTSLSIRINKVIGNNFLKKRKNIITEIFR